MVERIGVRYLRDHLTDVVFRVAERRVEVAVWSRGRAVRVRAVEAEDIWPRTARPTYVPMTRFRHHISACLRRAATGPLIVTWHDQPQVWVGPDENSLEGLALAPSGVILVDPAIYNHVSDEGSASVAHG